MLKISKNQITSGQEVTVNLNTSFKEWSDGDFAQKAFTKAGIKTGDTLIIDKVSGGSVTFSFKGVSHQFYWSQFKTITEIKEGANLGAENVEYVIFQNGKKAKPKKYSDIGKVKAALLIMMGYHDKFYNISRKFLDNCPEYEYLSTPDWLSGDTYTREEFESIEVYEWSNRKLGKKVEEIDPVAFYEEQMLLIKISTQFGSSAREIFKKVKDSHTHMFVFMHEDYNNQYCDFESLKESDIIKNALKIGKFKNTYKSTKSGKTSIAFDNATDIIKLINLLPTNSKYFIVDMKGDQLVRKEESLVIQEMRDEKLEALFS